MTGTDVAHTQTELTQPEQDSPLADDSICQNCKTPLSGPFCHQCGQPDKTIIQFFGSLIRELLDDIIGLDSRAARTLVALLFRPGFLTREYLAGRRFHYVPPLRLFLLTSLFCIFTIWMINKVSDDSMLQFDAEINQVGENGFNKVQANEILAELGVETPEKASALSDEEKQRAVKKIKDINRAMAYAGSKGIKIPAYLTPPEKAARGEEANDNPDVEAKLREEQGVTTSDKSEANFDLEAQESEGIHYENGQFSVNFSFLSDKENTQLGQRLTQNIEKIKGDPKDFIGDLLEIIPKIMLLLVPIFAIFMKVSYPFARRYYIEHLINAFHGHAFLFLGILLLIGLEFFSGLLKQSDTAVFAAFGSLLIVLETALYIWMPVYFLLALKNVYQQNWFLTSIKWFIISLFYIILFALAAVSLLIFSILLN